MLAGSKTYDVVVVGAGMAGLYYAHLLRRSRPDVSCLVLEREFVVGGRAGTDTFFGVSVPTGAGIGRCHKDKVLHSLLAEMGLETTTFRVAHDHRGIEPLDMHRAMRTLARAFAEKGSPEVPFRTFAAHVLGASAWERFVATSGYTDYLDQSTSEVLCCYGMDDNYKPYQGFSVPWRRLAERLEVSVGGVCRATALRIKRYRAQGPARYLVVTDKGRVRCDRVVIATDIAALAKLLPLRRYTHGPLHGHPFLRVYAKLADESAARLDLRGATVVRGPLQKIIPMSAGVVMVAYCDGANAETLAPYLRDTPASRAKFADLLEQALGVHLTLVAIKAFYWKVGTHHYRRARQAIDRRPFPGIAVIGEVVSRDQGWVKGALDTARELVDSDFQ